MLPPPSGIVVHRTDAETEQALRIARCAVTLEDLQIEGLPPELPTFEQLVEWIHQIPFEAAMTHLAPIAADVYHHPFDREHQIQLARRVWAAPQIIQAIESFVEEDGSHLVFDERYIAVLQRLLVEHASDSTKEMTQEQHAMLLTVLLALPTALIDDSPPAPNPDNPTPAERDAWARFTLRTGAYYERTYVLEAVARAHGMLIEAAADPALASIAARYPLDDWMKTDHDGAGLADQLAAGFAAAVSSGALEPDLTLEQRLLRHLDVGFLAESQVSDREEQVLASISASRDELRRAFAEAGTSALHVAWDQAVFEQHPFLRQEAGRLQLISPRALVSWFSDGLYFRLLDSARNRRHPKSPGKNLVSGYTSFVGRVAEIYARQLVADAHAGASAVSAVEVTPELEYYVGKRRKDSSDVYVVQPAEIVAVEVFSGRMPRSARVTADPDEMEEAITKMVIGKLDELHHSIEDLLAGHIPVPGLGLAPTKKIWPVLLLTGHGLLATPILWGLVRDRLTPGAFSDPRVSAPTLCDFDDLESLLALVEQEGATLAGLLAELHASPFAELPPANWLSQRADGRLLRPGFVEKQYRAAGRDMRIRFFGRDRPRST